jgi:formamidase
VVDVPNACSTLALPKEAFEFDISPDELGNAGDRGQIPITDDPLG